jgi:hypothetical protein
LRRRGGGHEDFDVVPVRRGEVGLLAEGLAQAVVEAEQANEAEKQDECGEAADATR